MLGSDKSRGYFLEMICADFLAGVHVEKGDPEILLKSISVSNERETCMSKTVPKNPRLKLDAQSYAVLHGLVLERDNWQCQVCGSMQYPKVHHIQFRSHCGRDVEHKLITLCSPCHNGGHR